MTDTPVRLKDIWRRWRGAGQAPAGAGRLHTPDRQVRGRAHGDRPAPLRRVQRPDVRRPAGPDPGDRQLRSPERGIKFETYAIPRIRGAILDELRSQDWFPRSPAPQGQAARGGLRARSRCSSAGRRPTQEVADAPADRRQRTRRHARRGRRRHHHVPGCRHLRRGERATRPAWATTSPTRAPRTSSRSSRAQEMSELIARRLAELPDKEQLVLVLYYYEELTLKEIGEILDVTESRVCQIHTKAIMRLKGKIERHEGKSPSARSPSEIRAPGRDRPAGRRTGADQRQGRPARVRTGQCHGLPVAVPAHVVPDVAGPQRQLAGLAPARAGRAREARHGRRRRIAADDAGPAGQRRQGAGAGHCRAAADDPVRRPRGTEGRAEGPSRPGDARPRRPTTRSTRTRTAWTSASAGAAEAPGQERRSSEAEDDRRRAARRTKTNAIAAGQSRRSRQGLEGSPDGTGKDGSCHVRGTPDTDYGTGTALLGRRRRRCPRRDPAEAALVMHLRRLGPAFRRPRFGRLRLPASGRPVRPVPPSPASPRRFPGATRPPRAGHAAARRRPPSAPPPRISSPCWPACGAPATAWPPSQAETGDSRLKAAPARSRTTVPQRRRLAAEAHRGVFPPAASAAGAAPGYSGGRSRHEHIGRSRRKRGPARAGDRRTAAEHHHDHARPAGHAAGRRKVLELVLRPATPPPASSSR